MIEFTFLMELMFKCIKGVQYLSLLVFFSQGSKFQLYVCNGCHDLLMASMNLSYIAILKSHSVNYSCIITGISKSEPVSLLQKPDLNKKVEFFNT